MPSGKKQRSRNGNTSVLQRNNPIAFLAYFSNALQTPICKAFVVLEKPDSNYMMKTFFYLLPLLCCLQPFQSYSQIVNIEERRIKGTNDSTYWYGSLRLGANVSKVKDEVLQLKATGHVQYKKGKSLTLLLLDGNFLRAGGMEFREAGFSHLRHNYKIKDWLVTETYGQAQVNKLLLIQLRALAGTGLRFRLLKSKDGKQRIYSGLAYLYEHNRFLEEIPDRNWHRISSYLSFTFRLSGGLKLVNTTYYQPAVTNISSYRFASEWRLDTPIGKNFSFYSDLTFSIDESLPVEAPTSTYAWLNGLSFKF